MNDFSCADEVSAIDRDFLAKVIPDDGVYFMLRMHRSTKEKKQTAIHDLDSLIDHIAKFSGRGWDVYHACASFNDETGRTAANARSLRALYVDLDCGDEKAAQGKGYATKGAAKVALHAFCESIDLPYPLLVDSGGGLHAYWPLEEAVPAAEWKSVAVQLKALCDAHGLLADPPVTADAARILRPVGSYNTKSVPPRRVTLLEDHGPFSFDKLRILIDEVHAQIGTTLSQNSQRGPSVSALPPLFDEWGMPQHFKNLPSFPAMMEETARLAGGLIGNWDETADNVARICKLLEWIPPDSPYEIWRDCIWALASLGWDCGQQLAEEWSAGSEAQWQDGGADAQKAICSLFDSFDAEQGITPGTLFFHAYANGMPRDKQQTGLAVHSPSIAAGGFVIFSRDDLDALPPLSWTVRGVLPASGLAAIYGEPGSGKSFLAIDLAARISAGLPVWFGHQIFQRDVVYAALEGGRGIQQRIAAWDSVNAVRADRVKFLLSGFTLLSEADVVRFAEALTANVASGAVIIIDTLAQATPGADENTGKDMGLVLQAAKYIADAVDGLVILVHHSGKDSSRGLRGHSSLNGAMDAVINVARDNVTDRRSWRVTKMKDAEDGATGHFTLDRVDLGADGFGGRVTSSAVKEITGAAAILVSTQQAPLGGNQQSIYDALQGHPKASAGWSQKELTDLAKKALSDVSSKHRASRAQDALKGLIDGGIIKNNEGGIFILNQKSPDHPPPAPP